MGNENKNSLAIPTSIIFGGAGEYTEHELALSRDIARAIGDGVDLAELNEAVDDLTNGLRIDCPQTGDIITHHPGDQTAVLALRLFIARLDRKRRMSDSYGSVANAAFGY